MKSCTLSLRDWMIWVYRTVINGMLLPGEEQRRLLVHKSEPHNDLVWIFDPLSLRHM